VLVVRTDRDASHYWNISRDYSGENLLLPGAESSYTYEDCPSNAITNYLLEYGGESTCYNPRFTSGNANIGGGDSFIGTDPATKYPECSKQNFEKCWEQVRQDTQLACTWDPLEVKTCACTSNSASSGNYELCTESRLLGVSSTNNQWKMRWYLENNKCGTIPSTDCASRSDGACYVNAASQCVPNYQECSDGAKNKFNALKQQFMYSNVPNSCPTGIDGQNPSLIFGYFFSMMVVYVTGLVFLFLMLACASCVACRMHMGEDSKPVETVNPAVRP